MDPVQAIKQILQDNAVLLALLSALSLAILTAGHYYYRNLFQFWRKLGLKGPEPWPVVGNLIPIFTLNRMELERRWVRQYGRLYGIFQGHKPRLIVADADVIRQVCIKDFDVLPNHEASIFLNKYQQSFLFFLQDDTWRRVRATMTPTFTSGKIKRMFKLLDLCADDLIQCLDEQLPATGQGTKRQAVINAKEIFGLYTMDGIASCCYGLKLERAGSSNIKMAAARNQLIAMSLKLFEFNLLRFFLIFILPKNLLASFGFRMSPLRRVAPLAERVRQIIEARRQSGKKFDDYLQLLLDAKLDDQMDLNEMDLKENHHAGLTRDSLLEDQKRMVDQVVDQKSEERKSATKLLSTGLTDAEILSNAMFLLITGLETTATLLTHCVYALAYHPEIQEKLYQAIRSIAELDADKQRYSFDYDAITSCQYLDAVISETLRCLTPVTQLDRVAKEDYYIEKYNVLVPKETKLNLAYYAVMNDPEYWPDPTKFDPERFMPENREKIVPGSYCPFGLGPRHCIGMRFSLTEAKLAMAKVVMIYQFEPAPNTEWPPRPKLNFGLNGIKKPLVRLIARQK